MVGFKKKFRETTVFYFQNDQSCRQVLTLGKRSYPERIDHDIEMRAKRLKKLIFRMSLNVSLKRHPSLFFYYYFFYFEHTNNYNTLHLQFITGNCYRLQKRNKEKKKDKVHKNTIVYILTITSLFTSTPNGLKGEKDLPPVGGWDEEPDDISD